MSKNLKLNILILEGDRKYEKANNVVPISFQSFHVVELFKYYLPKIILDGSSKLVIYFKDKPESEKQYMIDHYFGVSWYYVDNNDISKLETLKKEELNEYYLNIIIKVFKDIVQINNGSSELLEIIDETARKVRDSNFEQTQKIKSLSKISEDKQFKASVYQHIDNRGESWYVEITDKNKNICRHDIMDKPSFTSRKSLYKKSLWEDKKFIILDRFNRVLAKINVE